ncbi:hypothetical protein O2N63_12140 [Aliiroseovarius sp. KMU-50]|uniref:Uncharacterized protein n=1 Tax=Aliiroseovarius salicola TaxID=3009082 RepID=A0ABT4W2V5_9RHOB|nr:hypothetical protein [Aliiroseovarius sp. KMU-50]MDA5094835.1 hypothetical protein [Aliiroseovarius sp. KMU-50]
MSATVILAVGDVVPDTDRTTKFPESEKIQYLKISDINAEVLRWRRPLMIISPLMCNSFDSLELAVKLQELGYTGKFRVLAPNVANPNMILKEIASQAPSIDIEIMSS